MKYTPNGDTTRGRMTPAKVLVRCRSCSMMKMGIMSTVVGTMRPPSTKPRIAFFPGKLNLAKA